MLAFSAMLDPLRMANWLTGEKLYEWTLISRDGGAVPAANGIEVQVHHSIASVQRLPTIITVASYDHLDLATPDILAFLRRWASFGSAVGALDNGTFILSKAGLLDGYRATAHWEMLDTYVEKNPRVSFTQDLFVIDRDRFTAAGGTSGLDLMLTFLRRQHGADLASKATDEFVYARVRSSEETQKMDLRDRLKGINPRLIRAVDAMERNLEEPVSTVQIAKAAGFSSRELERQFRRWLKTTPGAYYRSIRLDRARQLLRQTELPVLDIGLRCGFSSAAHFSRAYSGRFGHPPVRERGRE